MALVPSKSTPASYVVAPREGKGTEINNDHNIAIVFHEYSICLKEMDIWQLSDMFGCRYIYIDNSNMSKTSKKLILIGKI